MQGEGDMNQQYRDNYNRIKWNPLPAPPREHVAVARADFPTPGVIGDGMDAVEHIDGKMYDSKSAFRAVTKANGMIEVGNDPARLRQKEKPRPDRKSLDDTIERAMAKAGI